MGDFTGISLKSFHQKLVSQRIFAYMILCSTILLQTPIICDRRTDTSRTAAYTAPAWRGMVQNDWFVHVVCQRTGSKFKKDHLHDSRSSQLLS